MISKYLFLLLALACSFACADVELLKVSGTENYTIKISKHVRQIDWHSPNSVDIRLDDCC